MDKVAFFAPKDMPHQQIENGRVIRSTSGSLQMVMTAPHIDVYSSPERKTVCPKGVVLTFYSGKDKPKTLVSANYGISYDDRNVMELKDSVVIIDFKSGDTSYLSDLTWNGLEHRIFSPHPVRSVNGQRVTLGDSFESDENFEQPLIVGQRGTILVEE